MGYLLDQYQNAPRAPKTPAEVDYSTLPQGFEILPIELRERPALQGRKTMKGVAITTYDPDSEDEGSHDMDTSVDEDERVAKSFQPRVTRSQIANTPKSKKVPAHLAMSVDSGSESDPQIFAPGWNLEVQKTRRAKKKREEVDSDYESEPEKKSAKSKRGAGPRASAGPPSGRIGGNATADSPASRQGRKASTKATVASRPGKTSATCEQTRKRKASDNTDDRTGKKNKGTMVFLSDPSTWPRLDN